MAARSYVGVLTFGAALFLYGCGETTSGSDQKKEQDSEVTALEQNSSAEAEPTTNPSPKQPGGDEIKVACIGEMADEPAGRQAAMASGTVIGMVVPAAQGEGYESLSIFGAIAGCEVGREIARMLEKNPTETVFVLSGNTYMIYVTKAGQKMLAYAGRALGNKEQERRLQKGQDVIAAATDGAVGSIGNPTAGAVAGAAAAAGVDPKAVALAEIAATPIPTILDEALPGTPIADGNCRVKAFFKGTSKRGC